MGSTLAGTKTDILDQDHLKSHTPTVDIINAVSKKDWFKALWYSISQVEYYLRSNVLKNLTNNSKNPELKVYDEIMNKTEFWKIIETAEKMKIIDKEEKDLLDYIRLVRNDLAHCFYLVYNQNINEKEAREVIGDILKIINKLNKN
ncbi:MAG: hypothetical protein PHG05_03345 [Candidatus Nanoarchaeia archaeon]|nr:hypothetical protein [Candidatus Nanoarchaeia archaeon]